MLSIVFLTIPMRFAVKFHVWSREVKRIILDPFRFTFCKKLEIGTPVELWCILVVVVVAVVEVVVVVDVVVEVVVEVIV